MKVLWIILGTVGVSGVAYVVYKLVSRGSARPNVPGGPSGAPGDGDQGVNSQITLGPLRGRVPASVSAVGTELGALLGGGPKVANARSADTYPIPPQAQSLLVAAAPTLAVAGVDAVKSIGSGIGNAFTSAPSPTTSPNFAGSSQADINNAIDNGENFLDSGKSVYGSPSDIDTAIQGGSGSSNPDVSGYGSMDGANSSGDAWGEDLSSTQLAEGGDVSGVSAAMGSYDELDGLAV